MCQGGGEAHAADCRSAIPRFKSGPWLLRLYFFLSLRSTISRRALSPVYDEIEQHMQMFVYEMTQMQVFRAITVACTHSKLRLTMWISRTRRKRRCSSLFGRIGLYHRRGRTYTNGTHVPPNADLSLAERIKIEHSFFPIVDGGDIMHIFLGAGYPDSRGIKSLALFFTIYLLLSAHKQAL